MEKKREFKTSIESFGCINYDLDQEKEEAVPVPEEEPSIQEEQEAAVPEPLEPKERKNKPNLIERKWL
jgi:hypothetical protein